MTLVSLAQMTCPSGSTFWLSGKCREIEKETFAPTSVGPSLRTFKDTGPPGKGSCISWDSLASPPHIPFPFFSQTTFNPVLSPLHFHKPSPEFAKFPPLQQSGPRFSVHSGYSCLFQALILSCLETPSQSWPMDPKRKVHEGPRVLTQSLLGGDNSAPRHSTHSHIRSAF